MTFPLDAYLARLGLCAPLPVNLATLTEIHRRHLFAWPFENLDPRSGRPVSIDPAALVAKLLPPSRGGYCFELNGLLHLALDALGFSPRRLMARVAIRPGEYGPRSHEIVAVDLPDGPWLCDVGFGGNGLIEPLPLRGGAVAAQSHGRFRLVEDAIYGLRLEHERASGWHPNYAFSLEPFLPADARATNYFISRSPDSIFTQTLICVRTTPEDRRILAAEQFRIRNLDGSPRSSRTLTSVAELRDVLADAFAITLPPDFPLPSPRPAPAGLRDI